MGRKPTRSLAKFGSSTGSIDDMLYKRACNCTIGEIMQRRESSENARNYLVDSLIIDAVFGQDIELIDKIVHRIDGLTPKESNYDQYANLFGHAIDTVLEYKYSEQMTLNPDDPMLIAMAKVTVYIALTAPSNNVQKMKQKHAAIDMVFDRVGGKKSEPRMLETVTQYKDPSWMTLPTGGDSDTISTEGGDSDARQNSTETMAT